VVVRAPARVHGRRVQQRADLAQGRAQAPVGPAADQRTTPVRTVQTEDHPHRGGLAGAVGPDESGDPAGSHREGQVVYRGRAAEPLGEAACLDQCIHVLDAMDRTGPGRPAAEPSSHRSDR
jgi:hypothetical protein